MCPSAEEVETNKKRAKELKWRCGPCPWPDCTLVIKGNPYLHAQTHTGERLLRSTQQGSRLLVDRFPKLFNEIVRDKTPNVRFKQLTFGSNQVLWWRCSKATCGHHVWPASVKNRVLNGSECSFCTGRQSCACDSFGQRFPHLLQEFLAAGNDEKLAFSISCGSHREFNWRCLKATCDHHIWPASVYSRALRGDGCSFCRGMQTCPCDSFGQRYPELLKEFIAGGNDEKLAFFLAP